ncbi:IS66 family insertion sequence element accessory protein TnpB [Pseudomaricurvus alcaniphilus]|uniref:IS66 family insertion sequence element accessory protein TnpB n=1 Tax=Pseudomaricurvus alcaniphilus TaxID=1166482 RepID=UPI003C7E65A6
MDVQVYLYSEPVDMRKSIDGLSVLVETEMKLAPCMEALFVFCNRGRDKIKLLCWEVCKPFHTSHYARQWIIQASKTQFRTVSLVIE